MGALFYPPQGAINISGGRRGGRYSGVYDEGRGAPENLVYSAVLLTFPWKTPEKEAGNNPHVILGLWCGPFPPQENRGNPKVPESLGN